MRCTAMNCLLHVPKAQPPGVLAEIKRVLKPGGLFYLGLYGGMSTDGIWEQDTFEPKRYFAMYPDEDISGSSKSIFKWKTSIPVIAAKEALIFKG